MNSPTRDWTILSSQGETANDHLAVEEPLEIRITTGPLSNRRRIALTVTMRTPGHDRDLALGYLVSEGIIHQSSDFNEIVEDQTNEIRISLHPDIAFDFTQHERTGYTTSSCGVCGKRSIDSVMSSFESIPNSGWSTTRSHIHSLPEWVRSAQPLFANTGGIHAAGLFNRDNELVVVREDVGRHNAVDKVIGSQLMLNRLPIRDSILFVSGRASFELVQKAVVAGIPILAAVGAPSSLAVELADEAGLTLCGFVRDGRFNIYTKPERIILTS